MARTAEQLVEQSVARDAIVNAPWTEELEEELTLLADDYSGDRRTVELWGVTDLGQPWRVRLSGGGL